MQVSGLACTGPDQCDVVGMYAPDKDIVPFVMTGLTSGLPPVLVRLDLPANAVSTLTSELTCASRGYCVVVGTYEASPGKYLSYGFVATGSGGRWTAAMTAVPPADSAGIEDLDGVACTSPGNCVAVGSALNSAYVRVPIVLTESGGIWGRAAYLSTPPDFNINMGSNLLSVSCAGAGSCVAVGQYGVKSGLVDWPMAVTESGGRWLPARKIPLPADANQNKKVGAGRLSSVSCVPAGTCLAVGGYAAGAAGTDRGLAVTEASGRFGQIAERPRELDTVSCVPGRCVATAQAGPLVSYLGGRWSQLEPIKPSASVVSAACFADGRCVAVSTSGVLAGPEYFLVSTHN